MTKIAYFNVYEITRRYYQEHPLQADLKEPVEIVMMEKSPSELSDAEMEKVADADIISVFVHSTDVGPNVLMKFPNLKMIALRSSGYNNVDLVYCKEHNIAVCNVPGYGDSTVAEFAFGLLLDVTRQIGRSHRAVQEAHVDTDRYLGFDLRGRTIGFIGTGAIGRYAAQISQGFQMKALAYDPYPNEENAKKIGFEYVTLDRMFKECDIISLHCPLTKENYHLLDDEAFSKMKDGVVIINTARGELIDTEALFSALSTGKVRGAGLDVLENESLLMQDDLPMMRQDEQNPDALLRSWINLRMLQLKNVVITPHVAFNSIDAVHRILKTANQNIVDFINGEVRNSVIK